MFKFSDKIKIRHRLLTRLLLSHILIVALPLLFTGKVLVDTAQNSIEKIILERNLEFTSRSTQLIDQKLEFATDIIKSKAKDPSIYEMNNKTQELAINTLVSEFDLFNDFFILDTLGNVIASTSFEDDVKLPVNSNDHGVNILSILRSGQSFRTDVYVSEEEHLPMLDIAEPILLHNEVVGFLYGIVDLKAMWDLVEENVVGKKGEAFIFNRYGVYIAHSDPKKVYSKQRFRDEDIISKIRKGERGQTIYTADGGVKMVAAYAPIGDYGWGAMIQQPTSEAFAPANSMRLRIIEFMIGSVLLASLIAYFYTRWIVKPVNHLVSGMDRFSKGELSHRIEKVGSDEIGTLAENFNEMADRLIEYQNTMKRNERLQTLGKLASVLSHEIRNPLNSMVINMQILKREFSRDAIDIERLEKFYEILATEIKRVDQLVTDVLLIARPPALKKTRVAINEIIDEVVITEVADSLKRGIRIECDYQKTPIYAHVDPSKIRQVFLNLLINAKQAMAGGGKLVVSVQQPGNSVLKQRPKEKFIVISFSDTGHGIKKNDLSKIFDFYYSTKKNGTGLGLAIVQQIIEEHQGEITVESKLNSGTRFTIYLPRK